ncbi:MAG: hypothetical protein H8E61_06020 [Bacteroidetes bacterium]|nr:hypothetical protein [Bacteroidota bacterium]
MKQLVLFLVILFIVSCSQSGKKENSDSVKAVINESNNLDWLLGNWERINEKEGRKSFERWSKISTDKYEGIGFTLQNADTVFREHLKLIKLNEVWNYVAIGVNPEPTYFHFIIQTSESFVCENLENDFPKRISYRVGKDSLIAVISDDQSEIPFYFKKSLPANER